MAATIVVGLGYGDEGKGATVDYLVRRLAAHTVVRFNGGPQAGHNVVLPDGTHHCFSQWGAGTFAGARTYLSGRTLISPWQALPEAAHLKTVGVPDPFGMLTVSPLCLIITPWHVMLNRLTEKARGDARHGSCGQGVGETMRALGMGQMMRASQLRAGARSIRRDAGRLRDFLAVCVRLKLGSDVTREEEWKHFEEPFFSQHVQTLKTYEALLRGQIRPFSVDGDVVFEGAQGVLLDQDAEGFPHVTWSKCTTVNADAILEAQGYEGDVQRIGVMRTYMTRHGAGPLETEDAALDALPEPHNVMCPWQGGFRRGHLDAKALQRALDACGNIDALAVTHLDRVPVPVSAVEMLLNKPVLLRSYGPTYLDRGAADEDAFDPARLEAARDRLRAGKGIPFKDARDAIRGVAH